ncbi:ImmA/IrrE family metallo-endopeptidase [Schleiferilactobacillus shenzhenensis]|uniref:ImmA/IrrE family metallo-endopeptidase n=1 Tax=Schleiferilactobacillus shenzhenensis TaxID=1231337 RepID=UPI0012DBE2A9|nr:ImmA/IrrE family metallo-endopeptidase [Schleiferilactobacillus shenzhenensis]
MGKSELLKMVRYLQHRYKTADPFQIAVQLNIQVEYVDIGCEENGCEGHCRYILGQPVIFLSSELKGSDRAYWAMAHELGHILMHKDAPRYYRVTYDSSGRTKAEYEADCFALKLLTLLYAEDYGDLPDTYHDLQCAYGLPELNHQIAL